MSSPTIMLTLRSKPLQLALLASIATPFLSRIPGAAWYGTDWLTSYLQSFAGIFFIAAFAAIPGIGLWLAARKFSSNLGFKLGLAMMIIALAVMHGTLDLASDSTAAVALVIFPILALAPTLTAFGLGIVVDRIRHPS